MKKLLNSVIAYLAMSLATYLCLNGASRCLLLTPITMSEAFSLVGLLFLILISVFLVFFMASFPIYLVLKTRDENKVSPNASPEQK